MNIYEEEMEEAQKVFDEQYSKGEYCHEQSFLWGFQEGIDFKRKSLIEKTKRAFCKAKECVPYEECNRANGGCFAMQRFIKAMGE